MKYIIWSTYPVLSEVHCLIFTTLLSYPVAFTFLIAFDDSHSEQVYFSGLESGHQILGQCAYMPTGHWWPIWGSSFQETFLRIVFVSIFCNSFNSSFDRNPVWPIEILISVQASLSLEVFEDLNLKFSINSLTRLTRLMQTSCWN